MKYRLVKETNVSTTPPSIIYVIETRRRFLFFTWYVVETITSRGNCLQRKFTDYENAKKHLKYLNKEKDTILREVIK